MMQQQTVVTNTGYVTQPQQTTPVVSSFANRQSTVIGILLIIFGSLSILFNIADIAVGVQYPYNIYHRGYYSTLSHLSNGVAGHGLWCGILIIITGRFAIGAARNRTRCMIITFMVLSIVGAVLSLIQMIVAADGASNVDNIYGRYYIADCGQNASCHFVKTVYAMEVLLALLGVAQLGICVWGAIICGVTGGFCTCNCPQTQSPVMTVPVGQPQSVTVISSQQQQEPHAYQPQQVGYQYHAPPVPPQKPPVFPKHKPAGYAQQ